MTRRYRIAPPGFITGGLIVAGLLAMTACQPADQVSAPQDEAPAARDSQNVYVWTDKDTGCQYLIYSHSMSAEGGITPRHKANGDVMCPANTGDADVPAASTLPGF